MKNIFLGMMAIALMASPAFAAEGSGKKKGKKKAKTECRQDKSCDPKNCSKNDKCCDYKECKKDDKCPPVPACTGSK
jgi:hypothetical protein